MEHIKLHSLVLLHGRLQFTGVHNYVNHTYCLRVIPHNMNIDKKKLLCIYCKCKGPSAQYSSLTAYLDQI